VGKLLEAETTHRGESRSMVEHSETDMPAAESKQGLLDMKLVAGATCACMAFVTIVITLSYVATHNQSISIPKHDEVEATALAVVLAGGGSASDGSIASYLLQRNVTLTPSTTVNTAGSPFYMIYGTTPSKNIQCVWALLYLVDEIVSYQYGSGSSLRKQSVIARTDSFVFRTPIHGSVSSDGLTLVVAYINEPNGPECIYNSTGAGVASFEIKDDCSLSLATAVPHSGAGPPPAVKPFQCSAHPHGCYAWQDNLVFCMDRGTNAILTYQVASNSEISEVHRAAPEAGQGPRHAAFHPTLPILYVVTEQGSYIFVYKIGNDGRLTYASRRSTKESETVNSFGGDVFLTPDGKYMYADNRGLGSSNSTLVMFKVSDDGLTVSAIQQSQEIGFPMSFTLTTLSFYCNPSAGACRNNVNALLVPTMNTAELNSIILASDGKMSDIVATSAAPASVISVVVLPCTVHGACGGFTS